MAPIAALAQTAPPSYTWNNVKIVAGGYVDGIIAHPKQRGLFYARTDVGGAYRYDAAAAQWIPLNDWTPPANSQWMGIESIAVDPNNANMLYLAAGLYTQSWGANGAMLVSSDQGAHFTAHPLSFKVGGNMDGRNVGERLQVDPNKGSILFYGTRNDSTQPSTNGLWTSTDSGSTWSRVSGFNVLTSDDTGAGVAFLVFHKPSSAAGSPTKTLFAGVSTGTAASSLYKSTDGGATWAPVSGGPAAGMMPQRGLIGPDGNLYITYGNAIGPGGMTAGQVWKYSISLGTWQNITPTDPYHYPSGYSGLALDPQKPGTLVVMTMDHWWPDDTMYRSTNGGSTWTDVGANAVRDASVSPWIVQPGQTQAGFGNWGEVTIDPFDSAHAMYGTGGTVWNTTDLTAADAGQATHWTVGASGIEETAAITLVSPTAGPPLISGLGDVCGFVHTSLTTVPQSQPNNPTCGDSIGTGLDFAKSSPLTIVRILQHGNSTLTSYGSISYDGGSTWTGFPNQAGSTNGGGTVAISADGGTIVWAPSDVAPVASTDHGSSWKTLTYQSGSGTANLPTGVKVLSDGANGNLFYAWNQGTGTFFTSADKGVTWQASATTGLPVVPSWQGSQAVTVTGVQGDIWLATPSGLYRSQNSGWNWNQFDASTITAATSIGFGKAAPGAHYPTLYLSGTVNGVAGLFRSTDVGASWLQINDAQHQWGGVSLAVGDPRTFGTVYVVPNGGRGIIYGVSSNVDYVSLSPARLLDTRPGSTTIDGVGAGTGALGPGETRVLQVGGRGGVPASAVAAATLNVTAVNPTGVGYLTVWSGTGVTPFASNLNLNPGYTIPNLVISQVDSGGRVSIYNGGIAATQVVVDVQGYLPSGTSYVPMTPARLLDTRSDAPLSETTVDGIDQGVGALPANGEFDLAIGGRAGIPAAIGAAILNVTAVVPRSVGYVTVWPFGTSQPLASNLNLNPALTIPNLVIAGVGGKTGNGNVSLYNGGVSATHLVADVQGYFPTTSSYTALVPRRLLDTRPGQGSCDGVAGTGPIASGASLDLTVAGRCGDAIPAAGVGTVVLNVTSVQPARPGYLTVWPTGAAQPLASNLNLNPRTTIPNLVIAKVGALGQVSIYNGSSAPADIVVDIQGWFPDAP